MGKRKKGLLASSRVSRNGTLGQFFVLALLLMGGIVIVYASGQQTNTNSKAFESRNQTAEQAGRTTPGRAGTPIAQQTTNPAMGTPTGLTATPVTNTRIRLSWQPVTGANIYRVYRNNAYIGQGSAGMGPAGPLPATTFEDALVDCGGTYDYQVSAVTTATGQSEAEIANNQSNLSPKVTASTATCTAIQVGSPVCIAIAGPSQVRMNTLTTFTFTYSGKVNAIQWSTTGYTYTGDNFYQPNGTLYPPNQLQIKWQYTPPGTYQVRGFVYDHNFIQSQCPPKTVTVS